MDVQLMIDNRQVDADGGKTFERRNPISGETVTRAAAASVADANRAAAAAGAAFKAWSQTGPTERRKILNAAADNLEAKIG
jgi:acyl-CoA reductase-like NAD-dependent aldehyde dehydrogenase